MSRGHAEVHLTNVRIIDPASGRDEVADLLISAGRLAAIGQNLASPAGTPQLDLSGYVAAPGLVDLHCHLREPGQEHKEGLESGLAAAAAGGFTTIACMPNTTPPLDTVERLQAVLSKAATLSPLHLHVIAAISHGQAGHELTAFTELAAAGAVAFSDDGRPVWSEPLMRQALRASATVNRPLSLHEEDPALAAGGVMNEGSVAAQLGLRGLPAAAEEAMIARDIDLVAAEGGRIHLCHVSTAGSVALLREAKARGLAVSAEVTPHHLTLTEELAAHPWDGRPYDTRTKVNPPLRTAADVAALIEALADGTIEAIATDHAPHAASDKHCPYEQAAFGISLFETALASVLSLVHAGRISLPELIERLTSGPARLFGLDAGALRLGEPVDMVIFHPTEEWRVDAASFRSHGQNTPLDGALLRGRVALTMAAGQILYSRLPALES